MALRKIIIKYKNMDEENKDIGEAGEQTPEAGEQTPVGGGIDSASEALPQV